MADKSWIDRFSHFESNNSGSNPPKRQKTGSSQHNRSASRYTPLKLEVTPTKRKPVPTPPKFSDTANKKASPKMEVDSMMEDEEDWGEDIDFTNLEFVEEEEKKEEPKITDEELQEMSMALINDDSIFELEGDDDLFLAPMEPARARLNQTMAVLAPVLNDFYDEGPGPDEIIDKLRADNKKLNEELKNLLPAKSKQQAETDVLTRKLEEKSRELNQMKRNLEADLRREMEKNKRVLAEERQAKQEMQRLREELENKARQLQKTQAEAARRSRPPADTQQAKKTSASRLGDLFRNLDNSFADTGDGAAISPPKKSRRENDAAASPDSTKQDIKTEPKVPTSRVEPTPPPPDLELDLPQHLPDHLAEQFCQLSTADTKSTVDNFKECQLNIVLKTRHNEDSSEDWGRMLDLISGRLTGLLPPLNSTDKIQDVEAAEAELARLVDIINFGGQENLKTRETEVVLEVIRNNLRRMGFSKDTRLLTATLHALNALWHNQPPDVEQLRPVVRLLRDALDIFQKKEGEEQAGSLARQALLDLVAIISGDTELIKFMCSKSAVPPAYPATLPSTNLSTASALPPSFPPLSRPTKVSNFPVPSSTPPPSNCLLQSICLEIETGCYKLQLTRNPDAEEEDDIHNNEAAAALQSSNQDETLIKNRNLVMDTNSALTRFLEENCWNPAPWISTGCRQCCTLLVRAMVSLLYSLVHIYLDTVRGQQSGQLSQELLHTHIQLNLQGLNLMKLETCDNKTLDSTPWIRVVELIKIGNKKRFLWTVDTLKHIVREPYRSTLENLQMEGETNHQRGNKKRPLNIK